MLIILVRLTGCSLLAVITVEERVETLVSISSHVNLPIPLHLLPILVSLDVSPGQACNFYPGDSRARAGPLHLSSPHSTSHANYYHIPLLLSGELSHSHTHAIPSLEERQGNTESRTQLKCRHSNSWRSELLILQMSSCNSLVLLRSYSPWHWIAASQQINK